MSIYHVGGATTWNTTASKSDQETDDLVAHLEGLQLVTESLKMSTVAKIPPKRPTGHMGVTTKENGASTKELDWSEVLTKEQKQRMKEDAMTFSMRTDVKELPVVVTSSTMAMDDKQDVKGMMPAAAAATKPVPASAAAFSGFTASRKSGNVNVDMPAAPPVRPKPAQDIADEKRNVERYEAGKKAYEEMLKSKASGTTGPINVRAYADGTSTILNDATVNRSLPAAVIAVKKQIDTVFERELKKRNIPAETPERVPFPELTEDMTKQRASMDANARRTFDRKRATARTAHEAMEDTKLETYLRLKTEAMTAAEKEVTHTNFAAAESHERSKEKRPTPLTEEENRRIEQVIQLRTNAVEISTRLHRAMTGVGNVGFTVIFVPPKGQPEMAGNVEFHKMLQAQSKEVSAIEYKYLVADGYHGMLDAMSKDVADFYRLSKVRAGTRTLKEHPVHVAAQFGLPETRPPAILVKVISYVLNHGVPQGRSNDMTADDYSAVVRAGDPVPSSFTIADLGRCKMADGSIGVFGADALTAHLADAMKERLKEIPMEVKVELSKTTAATMTATAMESDRKDVKTEKKKGPAAAAAATTAPNPQEKEQQLKYTEQKIQLLKDAADCHARGLYVIQNELAHKRPFLVTLAFPSSVHTRDGFATLKAGGDVFMQELNVEACPPNSTDGSVDVQFFQKSLDENVEHAVRTLAFQRYMDPRIVAVHATFGAGIPKSTGNKLVLPMIIEALLIRKPKPAAKKATATVPAPAKAVNME